MNIKLPELPNKGEDISIFTKEKRKKLIFFRK